MDEAIENKETTWADCYDAPSSDLFEKVRDFADYAAGIRREGHDFFRRTVYSPNVNRVLMDDPIAGRKREMIMLGSNSYLGLTNHPRVIRASVEAAEKYGYGTGSVSLYSGTTDLHKKLERRLAEFYGCEDAILFPTGYAANVGTISAIMRPRDAIVNDLFNHASIYDGCRLSGAKLHTFAHGKTRHLKRVLSNAVGDGHGTMVITDGVFSMEGDLAKLDEILPLAAEFGARVMVDDSHALGVMGPTGRGTAEHFGLQGKVDITIATLSKALGGIGGCAVGSAQVVDYLRFYARPYFFSGSVPTPIVAGALEILDMIQTQPKIREDLWNSVKYVKAGLTDLGFDIGNSGSAIIPVIVGDEPKLKAFLKDLMDAGIFMNYVAFPAVPKSRCRLRMSMMAGHTRTDLDYVLATMARLGRKYEII